MFRNVFIPPGLCVFVVPKGFLAAAAAVTDAVRVDAAVRTDVVVLLVVVVAVPFLVMMELVLSEVAMLAFGTRGRFSMVVCEETQQQHEK